MLLPRTETLLTSHCNPQLFAALPCLSTSLTTPPPPTRGPLPRWGTADRFYLSGHTRTTRPNPRSSRGTRRHHRTDQTPSLPPPPHPPAVLAFCQGLTPPPPTPRSGLPPPGSAAHPADPPPFPGALPRRGGCGPVGAAGRSSFLPSLPHLSGQRSVNIRRGRPLPAAPRMRSPAPLRRQAGARGSTSAGSGSARSGYRQEQHRLGGTLWEPGLSAGPGWEAAMLRGRYRNRPPPPPPKKKPPTCGTDRDWGCFFVKRKTTLTERWQLPGSKEPPNILNVFLKLSTY